MEHDPVAIGRILEALRDRIGGVDPVHTDLGACPLCRQTNWRIGAGFVTLAVTETPLKVALGGEGYPLAVLICQTCGNTHLLNLFALGLGDFLKELQSKAEGTAVTDRKSDG